MVLQQEITFKLFAVFMFDNEIEICRLRAAVHAALFAHPNILLSVLRCLTLPYVVTSYHFSFISISHILSD